MLNPDPVKPLLRETAPAPQCASDPFVELRDVSLKYDDMLALDHTTLGIEFGGIRSGRGPEWLRKIDPDEARDWAAAAHRR